MGRPLNRSCPSWQFFNQNKYTLGLFTDLSKAFNTVDHNSLLSIILNLCGIKNNNLNLKIKKTGFFPGSFF